MTINLKEKQHKQITILVSPTGCKTKINLHFLRFNGWSFSFSIFLKKRADILFR